MIIATESSIRRQLRQASRTPAPVVEISNGLAEADELAHEMDMTPAAAATALGNGPAPAAFTLATARVTVTFTPQGETVIVRTSHLIAGRTVQRVSISRARVLYRELQAAGYSRW